MITRTKWMFATAMALGMLFAGDAPEAKAKFGFGHHRVHHGGYGYGYRSSGVGISISFGHHRSHRAPVYYGSSYGAHYGGYFRGHRAHPTKIRRHNHYHVVPGRYRPSSYWNY